MKNIDRLLLLPLFAALAIGCSSPTAMQSSEYDDVYFSSKDKTVITDNRVADRSIENPDQTAEETYAVTDGTTLPNPEYSANNSGTTVGNEDYYSENYYDEDDYAYASRIRRFNAPYRGFSYYDAAYTDYYWYNRSPLYYGRSMYYDPFYAYDPFLPCYTCYGYPSYYGGINIAIGLPLYSRWGSPFGGYYGGLGYNRGFNNGFYNGFYNGYYANNGWYRNDTNGGRNVQYGRRRDRSEMPTNTNANAGSRPRGGVTSGGGIVGGNNAGGIARPSEGNTRSTRSRGNSNAGVTTNDPAIARPTDTQGRTTRGRQERGTTLTQPDGSTNLPVERAGRREIGSTVTDMPNTRGRREVNQPTVQPRSGRNTETYTPAPQTERRQRREIQMQPREQQAQPQRTYEAPQRQQRTYEAPQRQRTYEAPQRQQRSFEQPSSRPTPSFGGGSNGGSSSGGGSRRRD